MEAITDPAGVINSLQARIEDLMSQLQCERRAAKDGHASVVEDALRTLRLHGVVPMYVGKDDFTTLSEGVAKSSPFLYKALDQVWMLAGAPVPEAAKTAIQDAAKNGMNRWPNPR